MGVVILGDSYNDRLGSSSSLLVPITGLELSDSDRVESTSSLLMGVEPIATSSTLSSTSSIDVNDHGSLSGLGDDDHSHYLNNTRGDIRYLYKENTDAFTPDGDYEPATKKYVDDSVDVNSFENGLTEAANVVKLGGLLTGDTTITTTALHELLITTSTGYTDLLVEGSGSDSIKLSARNAGDTLAASLEVQSGADPTILVSGTSGTFAGIEYNADYSAQYTDRSLVDKAYVLSAITGSASWEKSVIDKVNFVTNEPTGNTDGDRYINSATGVSSSIGQSVTAEYIYEWDSGTSTWDENIPDTDTLLFIEGDDTTPSNDVGLYKYNGSNWVFYGVGIEHNETDSKQGGIAGEYFHLTNAEHTNVGNLDSMAYEATGSYYTSAAINTWRNGVTQTEMGYLHGVTSDIQTQFSTHTHDTGDITNLSSYNSFTDYYTKTELNTSGGGGSVHWDNLLGTPALSWELIADGVSSGDVEYGHYVDFTAGTGISITDNSAPLLGQFSIDIALDGAYVTNAFATINDSETPAGTASASGSDTLTLESTDVGGILSINVSDVTGNALAQFTINETNINHDNLGLIESNTLGEYHHLDDNQYSKLIGIPSNADNYDGWNLKTDGAATLYRVPSLIEDATSYVEFAEGSDISIGYSTSGDPSQHIITIGVAGGLPSYTGGDGIAVSGTTISADLFSGGGLEFESNQLRVNYTYVAQASHTHAIGDLTSFNITSVTDGEVLSYDSGSSKWINNTLAEAGISATGHTHAYDNYLNWDVKIDTAAADSILSGTRLELIAGSGIQINRAAGTGYYRATIVNDAAGLTSAYDAITADTGSASASGSSTLNFTSANNKLAIIASDDTPDSVEFTISEGNINHDALNGFVSNEHINHTSVSMNTGTTSGLTGGGTIAASRNLALDFTRLTNATALADTDEFAYYDASASAMRAITYSNLKIALNNHLSFGDVTASTYTNNDVAVWSSTSKQLEDTAGNFTWDGSTLAVSGNITSTGSVEADTYEFDIFGSSDDTGIVANMYTDAGGVSAGELVYINGSGHIGEADADSSSTMPAVGIALENIAASSVGRVLLLGMYYSASHGLSGTLYVSNTAGAITDTAPSGANDLVQVIGHAIGSNQIFINPSADYYTVS